MNIINSRQIAVIGAGLLILTVLIIYPPWKIELGFVQQAEIDGLIRTSEVSIRRYSFFWKAPVPSAEEAEELGTVEARLDFQALVWETIPVIILTVFLFLVFREPNTMR